MEEDVYNWFLKLRARKVQMTDSGLKLKALKLAKSRLADPELNLPLQEKKALIDFQASNGWVEKFKNRYKITRRFITTKCSQPIEEVKPALESYFSELNSAIENIPTRSIYNMDEVSIFF